MRDNLPTGSTIATRRIGALAYFSGQPVFDYCFGLTEPEVARRIRGHGGVFTSPANPEIADLWRERAPDYILEDGEVLAATIAATKGNPESFQVHGLEYGVVHRFPIARGVDWTLAGRRGKSSGGPV
jgi:hypothetical protein